MLDLDLLTSDSDLELDAAEEKKPRKKYEVSCVFINTLTLLNLQASLIDCKVSILSTCHVII